ncbi:MAG: sugar transferase [Chloroflexi bacterium]|nr:sugar transferase [Chloroflexota bacterium]
MDALSKRFFDAAVAAVGLVLLSPLFLALSVAIKAHDGGPVFHRATRVGRHGRLFRLYKFRSMVVDADRIGPALTAAGDTRITPVGRWLRQTKLDELPQLVNVLVGDMSLVGPRPEDPRYVALYTPEQRRVLQMRPGITSAASLAFRHEEAMLAGPDWETVYRTRVLPAKLAIDLEYLARRSLRSDIDLILRTVAALVRNDA